MAKVTVLLTPEEIDRRLDEMAKAISAAYAGKPVALVCVLRGAVVFAVDLARKLDADVYFDFIDISSYSGTNSTGAVKINMDLETAVTGKHVLLVEDILDTGRTLSHLKSYLLTQNPASLKLCVLLDKPDRRVVELAADYVGFTIPDEFVVGYGLDYDQKYRNLPYVGVLDLEG